MLESEGGVGRKNNSFLDKLFYEVPDIPEKYYGVVDFFGYTWCAVQYAIFATLLVFFGGITMPIFWDNVDAMQTRGWDGLIHAYVALTVLSGVYMTYASARSYIDQERVTGVLHDRRYVVFCILSNLSNLLLWLMSLSLSIWGISALYGLTMIEGVTAFSNFIVALITSTPHLFKLPYFLAIIVAYVLGGLFVYIDHYLCHKSRLLWLCAHRSHHISTILNTATVFEANQAFPLGGVWTFAIKAIVGSIVIRLFTGQYLLLELSIFILITINLSIHNHIASTYEIVMKSRFWRFIMMAAGGHGPYHYVHHSSKLEHQAVNLGSGAPFLCWDRVFGSYVEPPMQRPSVGLTHEPDVLMSPGAYSFAGIVQIFYELKHNRNWKIRWQIIFGSVHYIPPISRNFLLRDYGITLPPANKDKALAAAGKGLSPATQAAE